MENRFLAAARAPFLLILLPLITLCYSVFCIFYALPFCPRSFMDRVIRHWAQVVCDVAGVRVHVEGAENLNGLKSALILSNHQSHFDIPILFLAVKMSFRMAAKKELFEIPVFGRVMARAGFMPLDRKKVESSQAALLEMQERFKKGESFWMAPEGTRYPKDGVGEFKSGAFHLAVKTGEPILPVCIYGTFHVLPKTDFLINRKRLWQDVYVQILKPIETSGYSMTERFELKNLVRSQLLEQYQLLREASNSSLSLQTQESDGR